MPCSGQPTPRYSVDLEVTFRKGADGTLPLPVRQRLEQRQSGLIDERDPTCSVIRYVATDRDCIADAVLGSWVFLTDSRFPTGSWARIQILRDLWYTRREDRFSDGESPDDPTISRFRWLAPMLGEDDEEHSTVVGSGIGHYTEGPVQKRSEEPRLLAPLFARSRIERTIRGLGARPEATMFRCASPSGAQQTRRWKGLKSQP